MISRYARAADYPELSNMIQQHRAEDRKAGHVFMINARKAVLKREEKWKRFKKLREKTLGKQHSSRQGDRINKKESRKRPQPVQVNAKHRNREKQKSALDGLFAEAGY